MIYKKIGHILHKYGGPIHRPIVNGSLRCRVLIINEKSALLVKNWMGTAGWKLPGGGIKKDEEPKKALVREIEEELGISINEKELKEILKTEVIRPQVSYDAICFVYKSKTRDFKRNKLEITDARWFDLNNLPKDHDQLIDKIIAKI